MGIVDIFAKAAFSIVALFAARCLWNYLNSPLKSFPGHWSTSFSNIWRLLINAGRKMQVTHVDLHRKYGPAVRMGPNIISISDPSLIPTVFSTRKVWQKGDFYMPNDVMVNGQRISNLFSTRDEKFHNTALKPVRGLYAMTWSANNLEPHVDMMLELFAHTLDERFEKGSDSCDLAEYLAFFAWDSMSQMTFGKTYGMIEAGADNGNIISTSTRGLDYFSVVSQIPRLDYLMDKNPIKRVGPPPLLWATIQSYGALAERKAETATAAEHRQKDFLDHFLEAGKQNPELINDDMVVTYLLSNVLAGSDTTAIYMTAAMYYILKTPGVAQKIQAELAEQKINKGDVVSWKATQAMPYFDAVMKEASRIHPGVGIMVERDVPAEGLKLADGRFIPGGTVVGMNPWVVNRSEDYFGPETDKFVPERWLRQEGESEDAFNDRRSKMKAGDLTFGAGSRICLGRNIAIFQAYKLVATLMNKYDVELVDPNAEWTVHNAWFMYQYNVNVKLRPRV